MLKRKLDNIRPDLIREAVPHRPRMGSRIVKRIKPALGPAVIPTIIGRAWNAEHGQRLTSGQMRGFDRTDDLQLL